MKSNKPNCNTTESSFLLLYKPYLAAQAQGKTPVCRPVHHYKPYLAAQAQGKTSVCWPVHHAPAVTLVVAGSVQTPDCLLTETAAVSTDRRSQHR